MKTSIVSFLTMLFASSTLLAVMPAGALDFTLEIFGNANMDDTIDEQDIEYVQGIIDGTNEPTLLADANYDGVIDEKDIAQIELIISGEEKELTILCNPPYGGVEPVVTIRKPVERIVVLNKNSADAIRILQAGDKVVGMDSNIAKYKTYFSDFSSTVPYVGSWMEPDIEAILSVSPDIVIVWTQYPDPSLLEEKLEGTGIAVVRMDLNEPIEMEEEFEQLGYILDKHVEAKEFIDFYKGYINMILERTEELSEDEKIRVMSAFNQNLYAGIGSTCYGGSTMPEIAGGINIAADLIGGRGGYVEVDPEWIIEQNPSCIVQWSSTSIGGYESDETIDAKEQLDEIVNRAGWEEIAAVKNHRVYLFADIWSSPACFITTSYFAKIFYPDLFEDLDPKAIHQEYLTRFQGIDYDLDEHGVFVYPPVEV